MTPPTPPALTPEPRRPYSAFRATAEAIRAAVAAGSGLTARDRAIGQVRRARGRHVVGRGR